MEELIRLLEEIQPDADYGNCTTLIDDEILSSLDVMSIVAELEDEYDIRILPVEIVPGNFNSARAIFDMVERLRRKG